MTMQHPNHPDDLRLAALAASEPDALADSPLINHVSGCARCAPMVDELRSLHSALAELPDIQPSRPLRFLPAVSEPGSRVPRWLGLLRGITGPAMAAAILLIVVGAFGSAFSNGVGFMGSAGAAPAAASANNADSRTGSGAQAPVPSTLESTKGQPFLPGATASPVPAAVGRSASASPAPSASPTTNDRLQATSGSNTPTGGTAEGEPVRPPFGLMLGSGVVLLAAAFVARGYLRRRSLA